MKKKLIKLFSNKIHVFLQKRYKTFSRKSLNKFLSTQLSKIKVNQNKKNEVLFVGAGGDLEELVRSKNEFKVVSIDIDKVRSPDILGDISNTSLPDSSFDTIIVLEVFEHIKLPGKAIKEIYRILKPNGVLILSIPFIFPIHDEPNDFQRWTLQGCRLLTHQFQNVKISNKNNELISIFVFLSRLFFSSSNFLLRLLGAIFIFMGSLLPSQIFLHSKKYSRISTGYLITAEK